MQGLLGEIKNVCYTVVRLYDLMVPSELELDEFMNPLYRSLLKLSTVSIYFLSV